MSSKKQTPDPNPADYIQPLNMNGLQGRMMRLPAVDSANKKEILVIYGHHSTLERWWGIVQNLNAYGNVTMPDLPGFGGMDSFTKIGKRPSIDNLADYLAAFVKLRYKRRRIIIVGISFGFVVATRMLQRYPELAKRVSLALSFTGFAHHQDFSFEPRRMRMYRAFSWLASRPGLTALFRAVFLNKYALRYGYQHTHNARKKFAAAAADDFDRFRLVMEAELNLWRVNDVKTHILTTHEFLYLDNCTRRIDVPVWHVAMKNDYYFNNISVEQHFRVIFSDFQGFEMDVAGHGPSVVATRQEAAQFIPPRLKRAFARFVRS